VAWCGSQWEPGESCFGVWQGEETSLGWRMERVKKRESGSHKSAEEIIQGQVIEAIPVAAQSLGCPMPLSNALAGECIILNFSSRLLTITSPTAGYDLIPLSVIQLCLAAHVYSQHHNKAI